MRGLDVSQSEMGEAVCIFDQQLGHEVFVRLYMFSTPANLTRGSTRAMWYLCSSRAPFLPTLDERMNKLSDHSAMMTRRHVIILVVPVWSAFG